MRDGVAVFPATESAARDGIVGLVTKLSADGLGAEHQGSVEIVVAEAVNNIVEHAYPGSRTGDVQIRYVLTSEKLVLTLSDQGSGYPEESLPPGVLPSLDVSMENLPEGGFGWTLIRELTSKITYERLNGTNLLCVCFDLNTGDL